jgi:hypothetical protein
LKLDANEAKAEVEKKKEHAKKETGKPKASHKK